MNNPTGARIRVRFSEDGSQPEGVILARIHSPGRGWFCITPGGVAHGPYDGTYAITLARSWVNNFLKPWAVNWDFCKPQRSSQALSPEEAEKVAQEAVQAAIGVIRRRLVERQDEAKRWMLGPGGSRYFAGRDDAFRDALEILAEVEL